MKTYAIPTPSESPDPIPLTGVVDVDPDFFFDRETFEFLDEETIQLLVEDKIATGG